MEEKIEVRLQNEIGFLRTMKQLANKKGKDSIDIDFDNLSILLELLEDCRKNC